MTLTLPDDRRQPEIAAPVAGEEALRQALAGSEASLHALQRQQQVFAHGIAHDLRAPLRAIETFSALLERQDATALDATGRDYLQRIREAATRMGGLIEALLDYAQVERGELLPRAVDLGLLADLALAELQDAESQDGPPRRSVRAKIAPGLQAFGDERQLRMLVTQLLRNAWNFSGDEVEVEVSGERRGDLLQVAVRDHGRGFDMRYNAKLFEPFQRLHGADEGAGDGLGLAIAMRVVERHGGRLWAQSEPGTGSTFFFELPAEPT
jgi:signal transduction histidine kinase